MNFISYAQNFEDVLLWRALGHVGNGFYIDVGANDPVEHSVTKAFYDAGWRGISIEPLPAFHQAFLEQRPRDVNLAIAAGAEDGELTLYDVPAVRGWASPDAAVAELHRSEGHTVAELKVPVRTLNTVCEEHVQGEIHFLKIDVEGFEGEVLRGLDLRRWRPWILVIEATLPNSRETVHERWEHLVTPHGYRFAWFDGLNRYYVAEEHPELLASLQVQPNVFDAFISHHLDKAWSGLREQGEALAALDQRARATIAAEQQRAARAERLAQDTADELEATRARLEDELRQREEQIAALDERLLATQESARQLSDWARGIEQQLLATLSSSSWKITAPLRLAGGALHALRRPHLARRVVNRLTANERLRRLLIPVLRRYPALGQRVSSKLAAIKLDVPQQAPAGVEVPEHLKGLPVSVRRVLADLERARGAGAAEQQAGQ
ncbi:methyltransferase FkbM [Massilia sp. KIM]|uniref:FkbM family methyltransferase n=1 Tax=Massilia sp. KIM TaxID=1955422 RepID=UPI00098EC80B|nr:FkbM family methyltransferase [Massilia sp. KIM]OON60753.1 methyltransferase FkbM [Massilia sp. KIM]